MFHFRVTKSKLKNKKLHFELLNQGQKIKKILFELLNSMGDFLLSHFPVTNVKLINEKNSLIIGVSKWHGHAFYYFFCFVLSTYVIFIWVCWILMAYVSSTTYLLTRLQKKFSIYEPKKEWPHADLYNYNGKQIEPFHMKWFTCG